MIAYQNKSGAQKTAAGHAIREVYTCTIPGTRYVHDIVTQNDAGQKNMNSSVITTRVVVNFSFSAI